MFASHSIKIPRTAHYYTSGEPGPNIRQFWLVCHGYGQLASRIIRKFSELDNNEHFILAPEGLSRFYWNNRTGQVGASWMTKQDRLEEIDDYVYYLSHLYDHFRGQLPAEVQINLLGFSQGVATQCRWLTKRQPDFHRLILWAGLLPEDIDYRPLKDYFSDKVLHFVYGHEDEYLTPDRLKWHEQFVAEQELKLQVHTFEGKHEIDRHLLGKMVKEWSE